MSKGVIGAALLGALFSCPLGKSAAAAQDTGSFYAGKTLSIISYAGPAGSYTYYARLLARHMPTYLNGTPNAIVKNMLGAGGLTATRYLYEAAPRDGTTFGTVSRGIPFEPLLGEKKVDFDPLKFNWLGSPSSAITIFISWHTAPVQRFDDLYDKELMLAGTGAGADSEIIPRTLNKLFGTKFKVISGYKDVTAASLAMERGEVEGMYWGWSSLKSNYSHWIHDKKVNILLQARFTPYPEIPDVPIITSLAKTEQQKQIIELLFARERMGHPFMAPPGLSAERVKDLRHAFDASLRDANLLAEAAKSGMPIEPSTGDELAQTIRNAYALPPEVVRIVMDALGRT
jgi:tripartite-type tricarboxylate transporter receptor subunit TctC